MKREKHGIFKGTGNKKFISWIQVILLGFVLLITVFFIQSFTSKNEQEGTNQPEDPYIINSPEIPDILDFAGETVPLQYFDVREDLDRELLINTYWHSQTILFIKKANRYFPEIEKILKENGVPDDFKYIPLVESGFSQAVSPAGAAGFWHFVKGTAEDYGLEVNDEVDERYHLEKATKAACDFFKESYESYGSWTLAAASFNVGRRGIDRQIERQKETDYYNLLFNEETARYVYRILALKIILTDPQKYGFTIGQAEGYSPIPTYSVEIDTAVADWADFAKSYNTNYKMLKYNNLWLRDNFLSNKKGKKYMIKIPKEGIRKMEIKK
ncbi:MAG: transglycosylase SLT domain-containing protein [Bacteroidales bacterium]|nr:transglycosylase SLT domain-containing protein [Bacteroidales bacterium]